MAGLTVLGRSEVRVTTRIVSYLGRGGDLRVMPAKSAYGGPDPAGEQAAFRSEPAAEGG